ncbi:Globin family and Globin-like domain and Globin, structural domain-containing protein [Strongyloides ratti]|uniref:Globin family and Globin-like domain and Globin, structural domain-containing protein n=1 Tax=Strongyloides ratti TaxID=34506 RepID=A0A090LMD8_STRRB|nr:Globin family and Globin-like domain and Globin, structural domain-containing protein [Strongyloides ratti]CEF71020.1 Globin family and Globin-like domain and Globin, structural domain-containing protein [Strongyloides ratti]
MSNTSSSNVSTSSPIGDSWPYFDEDETKLLVKTWNSSIGNNMETVGSSIYEMIFKQVPEARILFPFMKFTTSGKEKKSTEFRFQALRFMQVLENAINCITNLKELDPILDNLGRRHGKLEVSAGFQPYFWNTFIECTLFNIRIYLEKAKKGTYEANEIDYAIMYWRKLLSAVIKKIEVGFYTDIANRISNGEKKKLRKSSTSTQCSQFLMKQQINRSDMS